MKLNKKNLAPIGFQSGIMTSPTSMTLHWRTREDRVEFADGINHRVGVFKLTPKHMRAFKKGKLSLVPPGFCAPTRKESEVLSDCEILHEGDVRSKAHLEKILAAQLADA